MISAGNKRSSFRTSKDAGRKPDACQICGAKGCETGLLCLTDFQGWACRECRERLQDSVPGRWRGTGEETELGE